MSYESARDRNMKRNKPTMAHLLAITLGVLLAMSLPATNAAAQHGSVTVQSRATVRGDAIVLRDVAKLDAAIDGLHGDVVVGRFNGSELTVRVSLDEVRKALTAANANFGKVSLGGFASCEVARRQKVEVAPLPLPGLEERNTGARSAIVANPASEVDLAKPISLHDHVVSRIAQQVGVTADELRIEFTQSDLKELNAVRGGRFEFEPLSSTGLGRVPVVIRLWRDEEQVRTLRVAAEVSRRMLAVVASTDLRRGQTLQPGDVEIKEVFVDSATIRPLSSTKEVIGQTVSSTLRAGSIVDGRYLESPVLVQKSQLITVHVLVGELVVRTSARAMEDGALDAIIAVRNDRSRETFNVRVIGTRLAVVETATSHGDAADTGQQRLGGSQ